MDAQRERADREICHLVEVGAHRLELRGPDPERALERAAAEGAEQLPYWTELWPAARALAGWLVDAGPSGGAAFVRGQEVLELGCGLGLGALAACLGGARAVVATDYVDEALAACRDNARRAGLAGCIQATRLDWHAPAGEAPWRRFACVIGADLVYEQQNAAPLLDVLDRALAPGGALVLADPRRAGAEPFLAAARARGYAPMRLLAVDAEAESSFGPSAPNSARRRVAVDIWRIGRSG